MFTAVSVVSGANRISSHDISVLLETLGSTHWVKKCSKLLILIFSAGEALKFDESPATYASKKENVDQVLHFMAAYRIKMRQISSKGTEHCLNFSEICCLWEDIQNIPYHPSCKTLFFNNLLG